MYLKECERGGKRGAWKRAAEELGMSSKTLSNRITATLNWDVLQKEAEARNAQWLRDKKADAGRAYIAAQEPADPTDERVRKLERKTVKQGDELSALRAKLKHDDRKHGIVMSLTDELPNLVQPIPYPDIEMTGRKHQDGREEVDAVVTLSDQHADRVIFPEHTWGLERYDFNIFRCRLWEWAKVIQRYTQHHLPNYYFDTLWVWHLGDAANGDIHDMKHKNHFQNTLKAAIEIGDAQAQALAYLAPFFRRIVVVGVSGNHGRTTRMNQWEDPHDNVDYLVMETMRLRFEGGEWADRVQIIAPQAWSAHVSVRGWSCHLNHGHGVTGQMGIPWYGFEKREGRVSRLAAYKGEVIDYFFYGHFHTPMKRPAAQGEAWHSGAWYMTDGYALNQLSVGNKPSQSLLMFSERFGRQMEIPIGLRDDKREEAMIAGEWEPPFGKRIEIVGPSAMPGAAFGDPMNVIS